jgi:hypothetical protein
MPLSTIPAAPFTPTLGSALAEVEADLLTAAVATDAEAVARAWRRWRDAANLDTLPAEQYPLLPALHANLARHGLAGEADARIKGVYRRAWYRNQRFGELADAIVPVLDRAGAPATLFGEGAAAQSLYEGRGERPIERLELMVAPASVTRAAEALVRTGWQPVRPPELLADPQYRQWMHQAIFHRSVSYAGRSPAAPVAKNVMLSEPTGQQALRQDPSEASHGVRDPSVDSRRDPLLGADPLRVTVGAMFWAASEQIVLVWRALPAAPAPRDAARFDALALDHSASPIRLRREAQLLFACAGAAQGGRGRLIALADAAKALQSATPIDWDAVLELAGLLSAARPLAAILPSLDHLLGRPPDASRQARLAQMSQHQWAWESLEDAGRARFHLRRWRRIAHANAQRPTPTNLLRYLQAAAGVARLRQLPWRLLHVALRRGSPNRDRTR